MPVAAETAPDSSTPRRVAVLAMLGGAVPAPDVFCEDPDCTECETPTVRTVAPSPVPWISAASWAQLRRDLGDLACHQEPERWAARGDRGDQTARKTLRDLATVFAADSDYETAVALMNVVANPFAPLAVFEAVVAPCATDTPISVLRAAVRLLNDGLTFSAVERELGLGRKVVAALDERFGITSARTARIEAALTAHLADGGSLRAFGRDHGLDAMKVKRLADKLKAAAA